jgi:hypothetical protein
MSYANWQSTAYYLPGNIVLYNSIEYQALLANFDVVPSTLAPNWVLLNPPAPAVVDSLNGITGNVVAVAGSGIGLTPGVPTAQDITIDNTGVLSLDGATGALSSLFGIYYFTAPQALLVSGPNDMVFNTAVTGTNTTAITWTGPSANFTVAQKGLYQLMFQATVAINSTAPATNFTNTGNRVLSVDITRSPAVEVNILTTAQLVVSNLNYTQSVCGIVPLEVGDIINCRVASIYTGNPPAAFGIGASAPNYRTFFSWLLVKPLP